MKDETEEKMKDETEVNNRGKRQKSDEVVRGRITFLENPPLYTPLLPFP